MILIREQTSIRCNTVFEAFDRTPWGCAKDLSVLGKVHCEQRTNILKVEPDVASLMLDMHGDAQPTQAKDNSIRSTLDFGMKGHFLEWWGSNN